VNRIPKYWIAVVAIVAVIGVLFVLITPAPDELPSTGPHSLDKAIFLVLTYFSVLPPQILINPQLQFAIITPFSGADLLSLTCARLC
jgi:hypothetical protein